MSDGQAAVDQNFFVSFLSPFQRQTLAKLHTHCGQITIREETPLGACINAGSSALLRVQRYAPLPYPVSER